MHLTLKFLILMTISALFRLTISPVFSYYLQLGVLLTVPTQTRSPRDTWMRLDLSSSTKTGKSIPFCPTLNEAKEKISTSGNTIKPYGSFIFVHAPLWKRERPKEHTDIQSKIDLFTFNRLSCKNVFVCFSVIF